MATGLSSQCSSLEVKSGRQNSRFENRNLQHGCSLVSYPVGRVAAEEFHVLASRIVVREASRVDAT